MLGCLYITFHVSYLSDYFFKMLQRAPIAGEADNDPLQLPVPLHGGALKLPLVNECDY